MLDGALATTDIVDVDLFEQTRALCDGPCEVLVVESAGHWPHRESAQVFERGLMGFLTGLA